jgi:carbon monoxide dehydrogenase subunit G
MKTTIEKEFQLEQTIEKVWEYLSDPTKIVECVPGAAITEKIDDKNYKGQVTTSFGPVKASYNGEITITELDKNGYKMILVGKGIDSKGKGSADMTMTGTLVQQGGTTSVKFIMDISIVGMLAQFGARLIKDVSDQMLGQFVNNFRDKLEGKEVNNTMKGSSMVGTVLKSTIGGLFGGGKEKEESKE